jgi:hypothetical protein
VSKILRRLGLNRLKALDPPVAIMRYQRAHLGELLRLDTKKFGRIQGIGHRSPGVGRARSIVITALVRSVCIDDACRLAYSEILPDERKEGANRSARASGQDGGGIARSTRYAPAAAVGLAAKITRTDPRPSFSLFAVKPVSREHRQAGLVRKSCTRELHNSGELRRVEPPRILLLLAEPRLQE